MEKGIESMDFFLLRAPRLPLKKIFELNALSSFQSLTLAVRELVKSQDLRDALFLASEELYDRVNAWLSSGTERPDPKLVITLYKYLARMATRPTPYGGFAGIAVGTVTDSPSSLILSGKSVAHTRLDMDFVASRVASFLEDEAFLEHIRFSPNNSLYDVGNHFRYSEYRYVDGKRKYFWVKVTKNPLLLEVMKFAAHEPTFQQLVDRLSALGIAPAKAIAYLKGLVQDQILVSELEPSTTGGDYFGFLSEKLGTLHARPYTELKEVLDLLADGQGRIALKIPELKAKYFKEDSNKTRNIFQTDNRIVADSNQLNRDTVATIAQELQELLPLSGASIPKELTAFKQSFLARYDQRELPLLEVLDGDTGLGYGDTNGQYTESNPLIAGLGIGKGAKGKEPGGIDRIVSEWILGDLGSKKVIDLEQIGIENLAPAGAEVAVPPPTFYALGNLVAQDVQAMDQGAFLFNILSCGGPSAVNLMGRFGHLDENLSRKLKECTSFEETCFGDAILAEIVHMPEYRMGNILQRPILHPYEIPFLGRSTVHQDCQIHLSDLLVSIRNGKVVLRSKRWGRRVVPRLSCAHNFRMGISIYRFLGDLQHQDFPFSINWDWGRFTSWAFLPRVSYKHIVLSRARWSIEKDALPRKLDEKEAIAHLMQKYGLPRQVLLGEGDNELYLDLQTAWGASVLLDKLRKGKVLLYEFLFSDGQGTLTGRNGEGYANEVIIPFKNDSRIPNQLPGSESYDPVRRSFPPGSEWVYLKVYTGQRQADGILAEHIAKLTSELSEAGIISKWFFIRYHDPDPHIRLRLLIGTAEIKNAFPLVLNMVQETFAGLVENGTVYRLQYDTYERELERYGFADMEFCESLFHVDSISVLAMLKKLKSNEEDSRWLFAMLGVDQLLSAFGFGIQDKQTLADAWKLAFMHEFGIDKDRQKRMDLQYRKWRAQIESCFDQAHPMAVQYGPIFAARHSRLADLVAGRNDLGRDRAAKLLASLSHMFINRLFFSDQRANEMVVYHFLAKYYLSKIGASKNKPSGQALSVQA